MRLTRATDYAVRALSAIAESGSVERSDLRTLAAEMGAPTAFLGKVLQRLKRAGLLDGTRGAHGGYSLARDPGEITVRDVIEAVEGEILLSPCMSREDPAGKKKCPRKDCCGARRLWSRLEDRLKEALESETIGGIERGSARQSGKRR